MLCPGGDVLSYCCGIICFMLEYLASDGLLHIMITNYTLTNAPVLCYITTFNNYCPSPLLPSNYRNSSIMLDRHYSIQRKYFILERMWSVLLESRLDIPQFVNYYFRQKDSWCRSITNLNECEHSWNNSIITSATYEHEEQAVQVPEA